MIELTLPPTDNMAYGYRCIRKGTHYIPVKYLTKKGKEWKANAHAVFKCKWENPVIKKPAMVYVSIVVYYKHRRDIQGSLKLLFDSMEDVVYENDDQVELFYARKEKTKTYPRCEVEIKPIGEEVK